MVFELSPLPYPTDTLEPYIDKLTMEIHHGKHHAAYINQLNKAKSNTPFDALSLEEILAKVTTNDAPAIRNNAGGHYNHQLFWTILKPNSGGEPTGKLAEAIREQFGSFATFKENFTTAAKSVFGSGWAWLVQQPNKLLITTTPNQDNPLMKNIVSEVGNPLLGLDVWEHAYYLKYQNRRADYIDAFFNIIDWEAVAKRML
ncbi:MAG: superoxide dismutase [Flammeovirgaceae bacterium]|nr:superoxide dismutase [Flammeovirgaceae bacterium]